MLTLGDAIRKRRESLKIKGYELANSLEVKPPYITAIEKDRELPSLEKFSQLNKALGNSPTLEYLYHLYSSEPKIDAKFQKKIKSIRPPDFIKQILYRSLLANMDSVSRSDIKLLSERLISDFCPLKKMDNDLHNNIDNNLTKSLTSFLKVMTDIDKDYTLVATLLLKNES